MVHDDDAAVVLAVATVVVVVLRAAVVVVVERDALLLRAGGLPATVTVTVAYVVAVAVSVLVRVLVATVVVQSGRVIVLVTVVVGAVVVVVTVESVMGTKEEQKEDALRAIRIVLQLSTESRFTSSASASGRFRARHVAVRRRAASKLRVGAIVIGDGVFSIMRGTFLMEEIKVELISEGLCSVHILFSRHSR